MVYTHVLHVNYQHPEFKFHIHCQLNVWINSPSLDLSLFKSKHLTVQNRDIQCFIADIVKIFQVFESLFMRV